jgi:hypothetical protein
VWNIHVTDGGAEHTTLGGDDWNLKVDDDWGTRAYDVNRISLRRDLVTP